jgi:predicted GIY-YIG superfamily endonuclease
MIYHVYTITCKQNEKMYIGQDLNPTKWFKQHALNPPTKMIADYIDIDLQRNVLN